MRAFPRLSSFGLGLLLAGIAAGSAPWALAEIRATEKNGLKTKVNGLHGGRCNEEICRISGGTNARKNKFHRFQEFDTRGAIKRVEFDTGGKRNLIVAVTSPKGSWINKALSLSSKANLFFLSPGGLYVGKGTEFINVPKLTLSTADQLKFSEGVFDVFSTTRRSVQDFRTNPLPGVFGMRRSEIEKPVVLAAGELPGIHLDGINVSLAEELLVNSPGGPVDVTASQLVVGTGKVDGRIVLMGKAINVDSDSELIAEGKSGGGLIEVGGSRQNRYASVRQAFNIDEDMAYVIDTAAEVSGTETADEVSGIDTAAEVSGIETADEVSGIETADEVSGIDTAAEVSGIDTADVGEGVVEGGADEDEADGEEGGNEDGTAASPEPTPEPEGPPEGVARGVEIGLPPGEKDKERELVDSILLVQAPPDQAPMTIALSTPMEPMAAGPMEPMAAGPMEPMAAGPMEPMAAGPMEPMALVAPDSGQNGRDGSIADSGFGGNGSGVERGGDGAPDVGPEGQGEIADGEGPPEGGGPEGDADGPGGYPAGGDGERNPEMEGADPAALMPPSLSGEGYEVSLSLESSFQMADSVKPSIGAASSGTPVGGPTDGPGTSGFAEGGPITADGYGAEVSGIETGDASATAATGSPEGGVSAALSGSEGDGASATTAAVGEEGASGEAGGEEGSGADISGIETADAGEGGEEGGEQGSAAEIADGEEGADEVADGGSEDDWTAASAETEGGETAEGETAAETADRAEGAPGADKGPSEKPKAPSAAVAFKRINAKRASENLARGDAKATSQTLQGLDLPDLSTRRTPTPGAIANSLRQVRQLIMSGAGPR